MGGILGDCKPEIGMFGLQFTYASIAILTRAALVQGMNPRVFVFYRQAIATLIIAPIAYFSRGKAGGASIDLRSFSLIFLAALIGVTINQNVFFEGVYLVSSSMASAMGNLVPAITFILAAIIGMEKINIRSLRSIAKIVGTVVCVIGAISMALLRGPKLLNKSNLGGEDWLLGCSFLFASSCCWSLWLILQVPVSASYPDHLSFSAWMCFLATIQSAVFTFFLEPDFHQWKLNSYLEVSCCLFTGIIGSAVSFYVQAWCISRRGPLFSAMFNPLSTVIVTILAALFLHERIYMGSLIGAVGVIVGLYVVLWGKANDASEIDPKLEIDGMNIASNIFIEESVEEGKCKNDVEEPLLSTKSNSYVEDQSHIC